MEWLWLAVIVLAIMIDLVTSDFLFSGFSIGALVALILAMINTSVISQIIIFGLVGVMFIFLIYPIIRKHLDMNKVETKTREESYIGKEIILEEDIAKEGKLKLDGVYWTFKSEERIKKGEKVKIISIEGNKIIIKRI
ncbi:NfeD family protein [Clostridium mediterraneense]|uniref:NfeD family protein n=1 Tax=Clostridium mediterraneense TaxID=1805472 RepID=UPI000834C5F1|nr:NfeD family protein [Clostridium mediterraneense]